MTEMSLDTFVNLYRRDHPDHTVRQAIEHLNELRADANAQICYFDNEESSEFLIWDSSLRVERDKINQFKEYLVIEGSTESGGQGWPVQVKVPMKDWYKLWVVIF